jgi:hypothetical protein
MLYMYIALESREPKDGDEIGGLYIVLVPVLSLLFSDGFAHKQR